MLRLQNVQTGLLVCPDVRDRPGTAGGQVDHQIQFIQFTHCRWNIWIIRIGELFPDAYDPSNDRRMVNTFDTFNASKSHAVDIQFEAFTLEFIGIRRRRIIGFNKLTTAGFTEVILFTSLLAILTNTVGTHA